MKRLWFAGVVILGLMCGGLFGQAAANPAASSAGMTLGFHGVIFSSIQMWDQLADSQASKFGYGGMGNVTIGLQLDADMYLGVGPHLGANFWTYSIGSASATTNVLDLGADLQFEFDDMYMIIGLGSAAVSVSAGGSSADLPDSAPYKRVSLGWGGEFAFGISYASYDGWAKNLSHFEVNIGYRF